MIALSRVFIVCAVRRRRVELGSGVLTVDAAVHIARVPVADLDVATARIIDLTGHATLRPGMKTFGAAMPGFHAGHFRLRDRSRAFLMVTERTNVLVLVQPERSGRMLLSLERPQALLDALQAMAEPRARR